MADVFISYSRKNSDFARRLIDRLTLAGKDAWVDWEGIPLTSPNWWAEIRAGIQAADNFLFIISPDSMASVVCNLELDYAIELRKRIVPVVYRDVQSRDAFASIADFTPDDAMQERLAGKDPLLVARENWQRLSHINWLFFRDEDDFDTAFARLITTVETDLDYVKAHTRYLVRAEEWQREQQRSDLLLFGAEIDRAEGWLVKGEGYAAAAEQSAANPLPGDLHREYIRVSRVAERRRRRLLRNLRVGTLTFATVGVIAVLLALASFLSLQDTQVRADLAATQAAEGQATLGAVSTQVILIEATVTQAAIVEQIVNAFANTMLLHRDNPAAQIAAVDVLVAQFPDQPRAWNVHAVIHAHQGNTEQAIADYDEAIRLDPHYVGAYYNRGNARYRQGDLEGAIADYDAAIGINPEHADAYNNRGVVRYNQGDLEGAVADYDAAIHINPDLATAYYNRGLARHSLGDLDAAIADYDAAIRINPDYTDAYYNRGLARHSLGDLDAAIADYDTVVRINPDHADAYNNRGLARYNLGNPEGAIADYDAAIYINPDHANAYNNRGVARAALGDSEGAIADYDAAIHINPDYGDAYNNRGNVRAALGDSEGAIADYDAAIHINPDYGDAYNNRGNARAALGDLEGAISDWSETIRLNQNYADAYFNRALAYTLTGQTGNAGVDLEVYYQLGGRLGADDRSFFEWAGVAVPDD